MKLTLQLPWPPSVNNYYGRGNGRVYLKPHVRAFRDEVAWACNGLERFGKRYVHLTIETHQKDNRTRDKDNILKGLFDALQYARVIDNDKQIKGHIVVPGENDPDKRGFVRVTVEDVAVAVA
jgi:crossover junction endodeoxyribonuclease RusA